MNRSLLTVAALVAAAAIGALVAVLIQGGDSPEDRADRAREPLYWVAPMDPSYRRDGPGKSPMGMDLVPVYEEGGDTGAPGTIRIDSAVINNLGVRSAEVAMRSLSPTLHTVGFVRWDEDRLIHEHPRVSGWIERLHVKAAGDPVQMGKPLYSLYSPELVNAQEELVLALGHDNTAMARAARERLAALRVPASLVSAVEADRRVRRTVTFTATIDGVVDELPIREGFYVEPGTTLMAIGALDSVWIEATVLERQVGFVFAGMDATLTTDYHPGRRWSGRVDYIYPSLDPTTRTLRLRLRLDNPDKALRPNMFTRVTLAASPGDTVPTVPREAVIHTGDGDRVVLALGDGRFRAVPVRIGASDDDYFHVASGVAVGDRVVTSAQFLLDSESSQRAGLERLSVPRDGDGAMDHGGMDHGSMDHGSMDHESMDHGSMDHGSMDHGSMDAELMDHGSMDHGSMDHESMNHGAMPRDAGRGDREDER